MRWPNFAFCFLIVVLINVQQLAAKLAVVHTPKTADLLSNAISSDSNSGGKNNEITETEPQLNGEKMAKEISANGIGIEIEIEEKPAAKMSAMKIESHNDDIGGHHDDDDDDDDVLDVGEQKKLLKYQENEAEIEVIKKMENKKIAETQVIRGKKDKRKLMMKTTQKTAAINKTVNTITTASSNTITSTITSTTSSGNLKAQQPSSFINPFGQLSAFLGGDQLHQLQDYNFLFNAERHTIFQLHTTLVNVSNGNGNGNGGNIHLYDSGRVLNAVVGNSLSAAFGVNPTSATGNHHHHHPMAIKVEEVQLYNAASLRQSRFNPFNPTRILIHGWFGGSHAGVYNTLVPEYLKLGDGNYNIFTVDWGRGAIADYITASYRVKPVGKVVAKFIDFLRREAGMRFEDLHVIGFSMGAHIAGIAGKNVQSGRLPIIYGLDPALPLFRYENIDERLALTDADYVEVIHTSVGSYGYDRPLGHVDFYVNYGSGQPGCFFNECSHFRAFQYFAEALQQPPTSTSTLPTKSFRGQGCDVKLWLDLIKNRRCLMGTGRNLTMGGNPTSVVNVSKRGGGVFYLTTNAYAPFAKS